MPECAVCSSPAPNKCARCKCVFYCSLAHQKEDWPAHKVQCPRLAQEALAAVFHPCDEELLLRITTCLAQNGYHKEVGVMVQLNKAFWNDEQIWDAFKDVPGAHGRTRLMYASNRGMLVRVKWLLERGALVGAARHTDGYTALFGASLHGYSSVVRELLNWGANANAAVTMNGAVVHPLSCACQGGCLEVARELCTRGADVNAVDAKPDSTPLIIASKKGNLELVRLLCTHGASVNASRGSDGLTALIAASYYGHLEVVLELCKRGAGVNAARLDDGRTALMEASTLGHLDIVRELCARGANVNAALTEDGTTALMKASDLGSAEVVRELCAWGASVNACRTIDGYTALMWACQKGHLGAATELCDRGANVNAARSENGFTALMEASVKGHVEVVRMLAIGGPTSMLP